MNIMDSTLIKPESSTKYNCQRTEYFEKSFEKLDGAIQKMLEKTICEVLLNRPYESKKLVSPEFKGKRSLRKRDYRIIFAVCELSRISPICQMLSAAR